MSASRQPPPPSAPEPPPRPAPVADMDALRAAVAGHWGQPMVSPAQVLWQLRLADFATYAHLHASRPAAVRAWIEQQAQAGRIDAAQLEQVNAAMANLPEVDADRFRQTPEALARLPWAVAVQHQVLPLGLADDMLWVASARPTDRALQTELSVLAGCPVMLGWAPEARILARLQQSVTSATPVAPARPAAVPRREDDLGQLLAQAQEEIRQRGVQEQVYAVDIQSNVVQLVKRIIEDAHARNASDIHIESNPGEEASRVRLRVDGDLEDYLLVPPDVRAALVSRIKVMSKLDISERRRPQDGKINFSDFSETRLELRVAIVPTHDALEDVVMRLLGTSKPIPLDRLGFSERDIKTMHRAATRPYGLILACGPTGSGKTTTLHSLISHLNTDNRKIWTAEDPIEITQPGLRQLQVNAKIGVTFASAMRAFLRADPDIIMIGEVRDAETAKVCIEASLTGHLVMSTLHTNSASESVVRLLDLGIDPMNFGDSLVAVVAQRLVRALCPKCKRRHPLSPQAFDDLAADYVEGTRLTMAEGRERLLAAAADPQALSEWKVVGCAHCSGKGYKGRLGIYEILENGTTLREMIHARAPTARIFDQALASGSRSLRQDALEKVVAGLADRPQVALVSL